VSAYLRAHPEVLHRRTADDGNVPEALQDFERAGVEVLVLNGGDGTVQHALTHLLGASGGSWRPYIAPMRGGRTNVTATDLGARRHPVRGLAELLDAARQGRLAEREVIRPVLRIALPDQVRCGMLLGAGMLHRAVELVHRSFPPGRAQGTFGAGLVTALLLARAVRGSMEGVLAPDKMQIAWDGVPDEPAEVLLALATTLDRLFLGLRPFWGREPAPVRASVVHAGARHKARAAPGILYGHPPRVVRPEAGYRSQNVRELEIRLDAGLVIDGELVAPEPERCVRIGAVEGVRFLRA